MRKYPFLKGAFAKLASCQIGFLGLRWQQTRAGVFLKAAFVAAILVGLAPPVQAETRTLDLYNTHTKERLTITFKKNGRFVDSALKELNRFLRDWRRNEPTRMDPRLFDTVWEVYRKSGSRQPIHVVSAYRSPTTNEMLRSRSRAVAKNSQHTYGRAMDFFLPDVRVSKIREIGIAMQRGGVGFYPTANTPFVHIDVGSVRAWPRMTRAQLVKLFPDGKTLHVPADGKPLPGYAAALAELKRKGVATPAISYAEEESTTRKKGGGLFAVLFGDEEDETEELNAASTKGQSVKPLNTAPRSEPVIAEKPEETPPAMVASAPVPEPAPQSPAQETVAPSLVFTPGAQPAEESPLVVASAPPPRPKPREALPDDTSDAALLVAAIETDKLPRARPAADPALLLAWAEDAQPAPKPGEPLDARAALAEVAQESAPALADPTVLAYAPATVPARSGRQGTAPVLTRSLTPATRMTPPTEKASEALRPLPARAFFAGKTDPLAEISNLTGLKDLPVYDEGVSVTGGQFAALQHPDQRAEAALFAAPVIVVQARFGASPYGVLSSKRFEGEALARLSFRVHLPVRRLALR